MKRVPWPRTQQPPASLADGHAAGRGIRPRGCCEEVAQAECEGRRVHAKLRREGLDVVEERAALGTELRQLLVLDVQVLGRELRKKSRSPASRRLGTPDLRPPVLEAGEIRARLLRIGVIYRTRPAPARSSAGPTAGGMFAP